MRLCLIVIAFLLSPGPLLFAKPALVITQTGQRLQGDVTERGEDVVVTLYGVETKIPRDQVVAIEYLKPFEEELALRLSKLDPKDVAGRIELARWAVRENQYLAARDILDSALAIDPNSAEADELQRFVQSQMRFAAKASKPPATQPLSRHQKMLTAEDVQAIRRVEWHGGDETARVRVDPKMARLYAEMRQIRLTDFTRRKPIEQARAILEDRYATAEQRRGVAILSDPAPLTEFRRVVQPLILNGCATSGCHGGVNAQKFALISPVAGDEAAYTNFYILSTYTAKLDRAILSNGAFGGPTEIRMIERGSPRRSLLIQYALPAEIAEFDHPKVRNFTPLFRSLTEPRAEPVVDWIVNSLRLNPADYAVNFTPQSSAPPTTQPSGQ